MSRPLLAALPSVALLLLAAAMSLAALAVRSAHALTVHLVPHTHDDVGWLKTVDQYYFGANNSIQHAGVQYILDSVVPSLLADPRRRFVYVEQAFFSRWWGFQSEATRDAVRSLVRSGQLEFLNGGWCMHDEAATHYVAMIDQTTLGHQFLARELGVAPKIGWQIDPFGHSSTQAALLSAELGFDALFFGRIDYEDHDARYNSSSLEFLWRASPSLGAASQVFTGAYWSGNYGPIRRFCFDQVCNDEPVIDDPTSPDYNVPDLVEAFVEESSELLAHTPGEHLMIMMGSDFQYENANTWFKNLDKIIDAVNADGRLTVRYSTPSEYVRAKHDEALRFTVKTDDFFPYADFSHAYWTGYFTSRPALKRYVRYSSALLQIARQADLISGGNGSRLHRYEDANGIAQHHDAVSGTSKQHVAFDYARRLAQGQADAEAVIGPAVASWMAAPAGGQPPSLAFCRDLNTTVCSVSQSSGSFAVVLYNAQARARSEYVRLPLSSTGYSVADSSARPVASATLPSMESDPARAPYVIEFQASLPAAGYATYFVSKSSALRGRGQHEQAVPERAADAAGAAAAADVSIENEHLRITFDGALGTIKSVTNKATGASVPMQHRFAWYNSSASGDGWGPQDSQRSGAYIFRPNGTAYFPLRSPAKLTVLSSSGPVQAVFQQFEDWITQRVTLRAGEQFAELEWTVGPVPVGDGYGKEVVSTFETSMSNGDAFYTDSNGREVLQRRVNYRPTWNLTVTEPVAGNFYPVNAAIFQRDAASQHQLTVLVDRTQAGASLGAALQLMVHRRLLYDDSRGVEEPLDETSYISPYPYPQRGGAPLVVRGRHWLSLEPSAIAAATWRPLVDRMFSEPLALFSSLDGTTPSQWASKLQLAGSLLAPGAVLPPNVELMTTQVLSSGQLLLRLSHQFAAGEDPQLSQPAFVPIAGLLAGVTIHSVDECSLTANQLIGDVQRMQWTDVSGQTAGGLSPRQPVSAPAYNVSLIPMQIRAFRVGFSLAEPFTSMQPLPLVPLEQERAQAIRDAAAAAARPKRAPLTKDDVVAAAAEKELPPRSQRTRDYYERNLKDRTRNAAAAEEL